MSEGIDLIVKPKIFVTHQTVTVEVAITTLEDTFRILIKFAGFLQTHKHSSFYRFPENLPSRGACQSAEFRHTSLVFATCGLI
jgi:hypothetical protein